MHLSDIPNIVFIYHPPFYYNRRSANVLKFHLMCGRIGHVIALVALKHISCEAFGK